MELDVIVRPSAHLPANNNANTPTNKVMDRGVVIRKAQM